MGDPLFEQVWCLTAAHMASTHGVQVRILSSAPIFDNEGFWKLPLVIQKLPLWGLSSCWGSTCFASKRPWVRFPQAPPNKFLGMQVEVKVYLGYRVPIYCRTASSKLIAQA